LIYNELTSPATPLYINFVCARRANPSGSWGRQTHSPTSEWVWFLVSVGVNRVIQSPLNSLHIC